MTKDGKVLGVHVGKTEPRSCLFFNKRVLEEAGAGATVGWDDLKGTGAFIDRAWEQYRSGGVPSVGGDITRFSRRSLTRQLAALLDRVTNENK